MNGIFRFIVAVSFIVLFGAFMAQADGCVDCCTDTNIEGCWVFTQNMEVCEVCFVDLTGGFSPGGPPGGTTSIMCSDGINHPLPAWTLRGRTLTIEGVFLGTLEGNHIVGSVGTEQLTLTR